MGKRSGVVAAGGACVVVALVVLVVVTVGNRGTADSRVVRVSTREQPTRHAFAATMRSKTFTIDERAFSTGKGNVSSVGVVSARIDSGVAQDGARVALGKFSGSALKWTLNERLYFKDGTIEDSGGCATSARPGGTLTVRCRVTIDGGSGAFAHASGANVYTCDVTSTDLNAITTCDVSGVISY